MIAIISPLGLIAGLFALLAPLSLSAHERRPQSVLVLDQSDLRGPFYYQLSAGLRTVLGADGRITIYSENLDLPRFGGVPYKESLERQGKIHPGIPPDKLAQVFDSFFTTKDQGMGIGLSIARTIILAHKGRIWAENQTGGGAAFRFILPLTA